MSFRVHRMIQGALDVWPQVASEELELEPGPLPWTIAFDERCAWHLAPEPRLIDAPRAERRFRFLGESVDIRVVPHAGTVVLPNGGVVPPGWSGVAVHYDDSRVVAAVALPQFGPFYGDWPERDALSQAQAMFAHEWVHVRMSPRLSVALYAVYDQLSYQPTGEVGEDVVRERFGERPGFAEALEDEVATLRLAVLLSGTEQLRLARDALGLIDERRSRHFVDGDAAFARVEDLELISEGMAVFGEFHVLKRRIGEREAIRRLGSRSGRWGAEGFLLCMLLDRYATGWQQRLASRDPPSPVELLRAAIVMKEGPWFEQPAHEPWSEGRTVCGQLGFGCRVGVRLPITPPAEARKALARVLDDVRVRSAPGCKAVTRLVVEKLAAEYGPAYPDRCEFPIPLPPEPVHHLRSPR